MKKAIIILILMLFSVILVAQNSWTYDYHNPDNLYAKTKQGIQTIDFYKYESRIKAPPIKTRPICKQLKKTRSGYEIPDVPAYKWSYGCFPTAAAMAAAFYDRHGFPEIYTGYTNNGVAPLTNEIYGEGIDGSDTGQSPISASRQGLDGHLGNGHVDDYYYRENSIIDPHNEFEHTYDCIADFTGTSQYRNWNNEDGATYIAIDAEGNKFYEYTDCESGNTPKKDGTTGLIQFYSNYCQQTTWLLDCYSQKIKNESSQNGFTWENFKEIINSNHPVIINLCHEVNGIEKFHAILAIGYEENYSQKNIRIYDTWDYEKHSIEWNGVYGEDYKMHSVVIVYPDGEVGIEDHIKLEQGNLNIDIETQGSFIVKFYDESPIGDYVTNWKWNINLYHKNGIYNYLSLDFPNNSGSNIGLWTPSFGNLPNNIDWNQNSDNTIIGDLIITATDNDGARHQIIKTIKLKSPYINYNHLHDKTIVDENINILNKNYIKNKAKIIYKNCTININNANNGFKVLDGSLTFDNCIVNAPNGAIFKADGDLSQISFNNNSKLSSQFENQFEELEFVAADNVLINISNEAQLTVNNSTLDLNNSTINLDSAKPVTFCDSYFRFNSGIITGTKQGYWYDPAVGQTGPNPPNCGLDVYVPGDKIEFNNSNIKITGNSTISSSGENSKWDGIFINNCLDDNNEIRGELTGFKDIRIKNSKITFKEVDIHDITQLSAKNNSLVKIESDNNWAYYRNNQYGLYFESSTVRTKRFSLRNTIQNSSAIYLLYPGPGENKFYYSAICNNNGNGFEIRNSVSLFHGVIINNNKGYGFKAFSTAPSSFLGDDAEIINNGKTEIISLYSSFPSFIHSEYPCQYFPIIDDNNGISNNADKYILMALGNIEEPIDLINVTIPSTDQTRFFPSYSSYNFATVELSTAEERYRQAFKKLYEENYEEAWTLFKEAIELYPNDYYAKKALAMLPYFEQAINDEDTGSVLKYLEEMEYNANLEFEKLEAKIVLNIKRQYYDEAITYLEEVIANPPSDEKELLAELDIAYCEYLKVLKAEGYRSSKRNQELYANYIKTEKQIMKKLELLQENKQDTSVPELIKFSSNNYPNPFNPQTTIEYSIPKDTNVNIAVYNVKGQKVKTLVNDYKTTGNHSVIWNGTNENNQKIGSGIYFYKIKTNFETLTKKMLLLK